MPVRYLAIAYGAVFLLVGVLGFIPGLASPAPTGAAGPGALDHVRLLGLFPVNVLHNLVHIFFGIWGLAVMSSPPGARIYARAVAVIYGLLAVMGLIPGLNTVFGLVPIYGHDVWLHGLLAAIAAYFGWAQAPQGDVQSATR